MTKGARMAMTTNFLEIPATPVIFWQYRNAFQHEFNRFRFTFLLINFDQSQRHRYFPLGVEVTMRMVSPIPAERRDAIRIPSFE